MPTVENNPATSATSAASDASDARREKVLREFLRRETQLAAFVFTLCEDWYVAEETLQETAVFICNRWSDFAPGSDIGAWLRTVARMRCREVLRRLKRGAAGASDALPNAAALIPESAWSGEATGAAPHRAALRQCLEVLPPRQRDMIERHYGRGETADALAQRLNKSIEAIYMALSRLRKQLRECAERRLRQGERA